jgi:predicted permease
MDGLFQDLRFAARQLRRGGAWVLVALVTLAVGIGANTAIFTAVRAVLLRPLPYRAPHELVDIATSGPKGFRFGVSMPQLDLLNHSSRDFAGAAGYQTERANLSGVGEPREIELARITGNLLPLLGIMPQIGRAFTDDDERAPVALISHRLWVTAFGSSPEALGQSLTLDGKPHTIIGVMPVSFRFPDDVELWTPIGGFLAKNPDAASRWDFFALSVVGRMASGRTIDQVRNDLGALTHQADQSPADSTNRTTLIAEALNQREIANLRPGLRILLGAVSLVLLIACANVANLLLARGTRRKREIAVRRALGASRGRLIRQLLTESVLLAVSAALLGIGLAAWGLHTLLSIWPDVLPRTNDIGLDGPVLCFSVGLAVLTGLAFGLVPALRLSAPTIESTLRSESAGSSGGRDQHRIQGTLVVVELALALMLLAGAGLLVKSFVRVNQVDPGYDTNHVLAARIRLTPSRYSTSASQSAFFQSVLTSLKARGNVGDVALAGSLPSSGSTRMLFIDPREIRPDYPGSSLLVRGGAVSPGYFSALKIPFETGRAFSENDRQGAPLVAVINQALAKALWPGQSPLGRTFPVPAFVDGVEHDKPATIVGVIRDLQNAALGDPAYPEIYLSANQDTGLGEMWVLIRAGNGSALDQVAALREAVRQADPEQPIADMATFNQLFARDTAARRFNTALLTTFAVFAVILALVGVYSLTAYAVAQRTRELGIRIALGASPSTAARLLLTEGLRRVTLGIIIGTVGALATTRLLTRMLFNVSPADAMTLSLAAGLLAGIGLVATWLPARRAAGISPMVVLRSE